MKKLMLITSIATLMACGGGGGGNDSPPNNNQSPPVINNPPTDVKLGDIIVLETNSIKVSWPVAKDDLTIPSTMKYQVHLSETSNFVPTNLTRRMELIGAGEVKLGGLKPSTVYYVKLVVIDGNNAQTVSGEKSITTNASGVINKAPTDVVLSDLTSTKNTVFLKWSAKDDYSTNKLKYEVYVSKNVTVDTVASNLVYSGSSTSFTLLGLDVNSLYSIKVVAIDEQGLKSTSNTNQIYTKKELMPKIYSLNVSEGGNLPEEYTIQAYWQRKPYKSIQVVVENLDFSKIAYVYLYCESRHEFFKYVFYDNVFDNWKQHDYYSLTQKGGGFENNPMGFTMFTTGFYFSSGFHRTSDSVKKIEQDGRTMTVEGNKVTFTYDPTKMQTAELRGLPSNDYFAACEGRKYVVKYEEYATYVDANQFKPLPNGSVSTYFYSYWTQK
jgi:hypothetical protein